MRLVIDNQESEIGRKKNRKHPSVKITDLSIAFGLDLFSKNIEEAQNTLQRVEEQCGHIELNTNS